MITIELRNLKGIKKLIYSIPDKSGVYILSGTNGCGKTSLLTAIDRIGNNLAFNNFANCNRNSSISYEVDGEKVVYTKKDKRWSPKPKKCGDILKNKLQRNTYYLSATGHRLYQQDVENIQALSKEASLEIRNALNQILDTTKFDNLRHITVVPKKGRQKNLHRNNLLYIIRDGKNVYSEVGFSLGERMLLNALDYINSIQPNAILLIDEIELALHPIAQVKFYEYLRNIAKAKGLTVIISTHSSTLIKNAQKLHYLDNKNGIITTNYDATPALVLKEVSIEADNRPDYIFFVEDEMATSYMKYVLCEYRKLREEDVDKMIKVVPVGGFKQVVELMARMQSIPPFNDKCLHCFLDKDVEDEINKEKIKSQGKRDESLLSLFLKHNKHIDYLHITPELGIWSVLRIDCSWLESTLEEKFGKLFFRLNNEIITIEQNNIGDNDRKRAKHCLKELCNRIVLNTASEYCVVLDLIWQSFVKYKIQSKEYQDEITQQIKKAINKK